MNNYTLHNVKICSELDLSDYIPLLDKEVGGNEALKICPTYCIWIISFQEFSDGLLEGCKRIAMHPLSKKEIWRDHKISKTIEKGCNEAVIKTDDTCIIYLSDIRNVYSYLRSKVCEVIRDYMLGFYPFGLHAALIGKKEELSLIVGDKGAGKTSAILYARQRGWNIYTDELVLIDSECIKVLERFPAIAPEVEREFFGNENFTLHCKIKSYLTGEDKNIIELNLQKCSNFTLSSIKNVFVLTNCNNKKMIEGYKKSIFLRNFINGTNFLNQQYEIAQELIFRSEMLSIKGFIKRIQEE